MSSKGKPLNPQSRLNPPMQRGPLQVGQTGVWDGQTWVPETITATAAATGTGTGTVTSVDMTVPKELSVGGNPVTTSGTLALGWVGEAANTVFAGPTSGGSATPGFRTLVAADIAGLAATITGSATQVAVCDGSGNAAGSANCSFNTTGFIFSVGDVGNAVNRTRLVLNDSTQLVVLNTSGVCAFGDWDQMVGGMWFQVDNATGRLISWGDLGGMNNGTNCTLDDATQAFSANCGGAVFVVDGANAKITSSVKQEVSGNITVMTNGQGIHQQSPNGHYWRQDVSDLGVATWNDIGTSPP